MRDAGVGSFRADSDFERKAAVVLGLSARGYQGRRLGLGEHVLCADEKASIQARIGLRRKPVRRETSLTETRLMKCRRRSSAHCSTTSTSTALNTAVTNLTAAGVFVTVSAGNKNKDACNVSPASASGTLTAASAD